MESHIYVAIDETLLKNQASVSPSLKAYGIPGRARLFEVIQKVRKVNRAITPGHRFTGESCDDTELKSNPSLKAKHAVLATRRNQ